MLPSQDLRDLSVPSGLRATGAIVGDWALILANFALAILVPHPLVWVFCFVFASRQQLALAILMHDGSHRRLYASARVNDLVCQLTCAAPLFFSMASYQRLHLRHHKAPLAAGDPDLSLIGGYPISRASFARKLLRDFFGVSYFKFLRYFVHMARAPRVRVASAEPEGPWPRELTGQGAGKGLSMLGLAASIVGAASLLWGGLFLLGHGWFFLWFWFLPAVTALQVLLRIRGIAEHAGYRPGPDQSRNARTVLPSWQTALFAPHHVNFHIEHHLYPSVPFFRLPELHARLAGAVPKENVYRGYGSVLRELVR